MSLEKYWLYQPVTAPPTAAAATPKPAIATIPIPPVIKAKAPVATRPKPPPIAICPLLFENSPPIVAAFVSSCC